MEKVTILNINEVADMLRLTTATVYKYASNGTIPCVRVGRNYRFSKELLESWIKTENAPK